MKNFIDWTKAVLAFVGKCALFAIHWVWHQANNLVTDIEGAFDGWKIAGFACIVVSFIFGFGILDLAKIGKTDAATLGVLAGILITFSGFATLLFNQSRKSDENLSKNPSNTPVLSVPTFEAPSVISTGTPGSGA